MTREVAAADWPVELVRLYEEQYLQFVRLAFLMVGSRAAADEIVQDAFLAARAKWGAIRTSPGGYLRQTVVNGARGLLRRHDLERRHLPDPPPSDAHADLVDLRDALARLSTAQRTAIVLRYWAQLPDDETAALMQCRVGTVRSHLSRGIAILRKELS